MDERTRTNHNHDTSRDAIHRVSEYNEPRTVPPENPDRKIVKVVIILFAAAIMASFITLTLIFISWMK